MDQVDSTSAALMRIQEHLVPLRTTADANEAPAVWPRELYLDVPQPTLLTVQDERPNFQLLPPPEKEDLVPEAALAIATLIAQLQQPCQEEPLPAPSLTPPSEPEELDAPHYRLASSCVDDLQTDIASILGHLQGRAADLEKILEPAEANELVPESPRLPSKSPALGSPDVPAAPALRTGKTYEDVYALVDDLDADVHKLVNSTESLGLLPGPLGFDPDIHSRSTILMQSDSSTSLMQSCAAAQYRQHELAMMEAKRTWQAERDAELEAERRKAAKALSDAVDDTRAAMEVQLEKDRKEVAKVLSEAEREKKRLADSEEATREAQELLAESQKAAEIKKGLLEAELQAYLNSSHRAAESLVSESRASRFQLESEIQVLLDSAAASRLGLESELDASQDASSRAAVSARESQAALHLELEEANSTSAIASGEARSASAKAVEMVDEANQALKSAERDYLRKAHGLAEREAAWEPELRAECNAVASLKEALEANKAHLQSELQSELQAQSAASQQAAAELRESSRVAEAKIVEQKKDDDGRVHLELQLQERRQKIAQSYAAKFVMQSEATVMRAAIIGWWRVVVEESLQKTAAVSRAQLESELRSEWEARLAEFHSAEKPSQEEVSNARLEQQLHTAQDTVKQLLLDREHLSSAMRMQAKHLSAAKVQAASRVTFLSQLEVEAAEANRGHLEFELQAERQTAEMASAQSAAASRVQFATVLEVEAAHAKQAELTAELDAARNAAARAANRIRFEADRSTEALEANRIRFEAELEAERERARRALAEALEAGRQLRSERHRAAGALSARVRAPTMDLATEVVGEVATAAAKAAVEVASGVAWGRAASPQTTMALTSQVQASSTSQVPAGQHYEGHQEPVDSGVATPVSLDVHGEPVDADAAAASSLEVLVTHSAGIPENSVLSLRVGTSRRQQSALTKLHTHPLKVPMVPASTRDSLRLRILNVKAEARLVLHPLQERYNLKLRGPGCAMEPMLRLRIRGHQHAAGERTKDLNSGHDAYLGVHAMEQYMASLLRCMAHEKIEDTVGFMRGQFEALIGTEKEATTNYDIPSGHIEVTLLNAEGLADGSILTLAGPVKAQAPVSQLLQQSWKLPFRSNSLEPFKFMLLHAAGEARLQMNPQQHLYFLQFPASQDGSQPSMELGLQLRRIGKHSAGVMVPQHCPSEQVEDKKEHATNVVAMSAHQYLEAHKLVSLTKDLLRQLVRDKPQDPYRFLLGYLEPVAPKDFVIPDVPPEVVGPKVPVIQAVQPEGPAICVAATLCQRKESKDLVIPDVAPEMVEPKAFVIEAVQPERPAICAAATLCERKESKQQLVDNVCSSCGNVFLSDAIFCRKCGAKRGASKETVTPKHADAGGDPKLVHHADVVSQPVDIGASGSHVPGLEPSACQYKSSHEVYGDF
jgi:hypothetical protein